MPPIKQLAMGTMRISSASASGRNEVAPPGTAGSPGVVRTVSAFEVYGEAEERRLRKSLSQFGGEAAERIGRVVSAVPRGPLVRPVAPVPADSMLDTLEQCFPNFAEAVELIRCACALCTPETGFRLAPTVLDGPPGVGKTAFARALGRLLLAPPIMLNMASATAGFTLGGLDLRWSTGAPGTIFQTLVLAEAGLPANRLIVLDELDKAGTDPRGNPLGPLYALLEPSTAKQFRDEAIDLPIDASALLWLATSNRADDIPPALRSRLEVVRVTMPNAAQKPAAVRSAWIDMRQQEACWGYRFPESLEEGVVERVCKLASVREMCKVMRRAAGHAAKAGRTQIVPGDVDKAVNCSSIALPRLGFV
ncbi:MAG: AAA family ATPase [Vitreoscilla sp.]|nr:AAA family ATPase [Vitreoscilla sp.]